MMLLLVLLVSCVGVPQPAWPTVKVVDPTAVKYPEPFCSEEKCEIPEGWNDHEGAKWTPEGLEYTVTEIGAMRVTERPDGSWKTEIQTYVRVDEAEDVSKCWKLVWVEVEDPK